MTKRLSHSAITRYQTCPRSYHYHYNERLRPTTTSGALIFGSAMDAALNTLALTRDVAKAEAEFDKAWLTANIGNKMQDVPFCEDIVYAASDGDLEILPKEDLALLEKTAEERGFTGHIEIILENILEAKKRRGWANLESGDRQIYNYSNWLSLKAKSRLMLAAYAQKVLPMFKKVLASQLAIDLKNDDGDSIIGFVDLVVELEDGRIAILDNKTSSIEYAEDSVKRSAQLALYKNGVTEWPTTWAGYIVIRKGIIKNRSKMCKECGHEAEKGSRHRTCANEMNGKRCGGEWIEWIQPEADINVIIDEIPAATENLVMENCADITHMIKQEIYPRNLNSCKQPWGDCAYMQYCWGNDATGLEVVTETAVDKKK